MTLTPIPAGAWRRIAEEVQRTYTQDLQLEPHDVELYMTGEPNKLEQLPAEIQDAIIRTARTYGIGGRG